MSGRKRSYARLENVPQMSVPQQDEEDLAILMHSIQGSCRSRISKSVSEFSNVCMHRFD